jgi:hypothetical protein
MGAGALADDQPQASNTGAKGTMPTTTVGELVTATAKVAKVNLDKHEVTLKADTGESFTVDVPADVSRLKNVKEGDSVKASFYESVAVSLGKPGSAPMGESSRSFEQRAPGNLPGGTSGQQVTTTAKVTKVDPQKDEVTIKSPDGNENTIRVKDDQNRQALRDLKVGDQVQATYTTAMAVSILPKSA